MTDAKQETPQPAQPTQRQASYEQLVSAITVLNAHTNDLDVEIGNLKRERKELKMIVDQLVEENKNLKVNTAELNSRLLAAQEAAKKTTKSESAPPVPAAIEGSQDGSGSEPS